MPTYERRFFLGILTKESTEKEEENERLKAEHNNKSTGSSRTRTVSGEVLKLKLQTGEIPNQL